VSDPYGSHLPTLAYVLAKVQPKRVLELGMGRYSTPMFLYWPSVEWLHSLETDPEWAEEFTDDKLLVSLVDDVAENLPDLTAYDLVFIDDSDNATDRQRTIRAVLSKEHPVTVIHDADFPPYVQAMAEFVDDVWVIGDEKPVTAVIWE
jgi:predicted O-methyltransferase YrrM